MTSIGDDSEMHICGISLPFDVQASNVRLAASFASNSPRLRHESPLEPRGRLAKQLG